MGGQQLPSSSSFSHPLLDKRKERVKAEGREGRPKKTKNEGDGGKKGREKKSLLFCSPACESCQGTLNSHPSQGD